MEFLSGIICTELALLFLLRGREGGSRNGLDTQLYYLLKIMFLLLVGGTPYLKTSNVWLNFNLFKYALSTLLLKVKLKNQ